MTFPSLRILVGTIQLGFFTLLKRFCHSFNNLREIRKWILN